MSTRQRLFESELSFEMVATLFAEMLSKKFAEQGLRLSRKQKEKVIAHLKSAGCDLSSLSDFPFSFPTWRFWETREIKIEFTENDLADFDRAADKVAEELPEVVNTLIGEAAATLLQNLKRDWRRQSRNDNADRRQFVRRLYRAWNRPFDLLSLLMTMCTALGDSVNETVRASNSARPHLVDVLTRLHARACQVASEIMVLMQNGFADGAMARWRTLHEISVVAQFIAKGGEDLAERYALFRSYEARKGSRQYQDYSERLGYEPLSQEEISAIEDNYERLKHRLGHPINGDYDWALHALGTSKATFALIEEAVGVDQLRPFWRMASHNVHSNPKGVFFKLGLVDESNVLLTGPSDFGLADPGQLTAISLVQVTASLTTLNTDFDTLVVLKAIASISQEIKESFATVQAELRAGQSSDEYHRPLGE